MENYDDVHNGNMDEVDCDDNDDDDYEYGGDDNDDEDDDHDGYQPNCAAVVSGFELTEG